MIFYYGNRISPHMTDTPEGYLICHDVPIARIGDMEYTAGEAQLDGDPDRLITVHRYPEDVFQDAVLGSFEGKDVTAGHPPENVGPENFSAYSKGHVEHVRRNGDYLVADLHIKDAGLISDIKNGVLREVSCGYLCRYEPDGDAFKQTEIRGNHVAVVPRGRAGRSVAIQDHAAEVAEKGRKNMSKFTKAILSVFGTAVQDAEPEEVQEMVDAAAAALEAEPAEKAPDAEPAEDVMVERAPKGDDLGSKLDRVLEMLAALEHRGDRKEKKLSDEEDLDEMIEKLSGGEKLPDRESSVTVPAGEVDDELTPEAKDAAVELLRKVRPAVAAIQDRSERARVTDALLGAIRGRNVAGDIMRAAQDHARKTADAAAKTNYETICARQKAEYDARNPHKVKKED